MTTKQYVVLGIVVAVLIIGAIAFSGSGTQTSVENPAVSTTGSQSPSSSSSSSSQQPIASDLAGTYVAYLPSASSPGRTIVMQVNADKTVTLTQDYQNGKAASVETGKWNLSGATFAASFDKKDGGFIAVPETMRFSRAGNVLGLIDYDKSVWGSAGLFLSKSPLALDSEWTWRETKHPAGTTILPSGKPFVVTFASTGKATMTGDCNSWFGTYTLKEGNKVSVNLNGSTKVFCQNTQEKTVTKDLNSAVSYTASGSSLIFTLSDGGSMTFSRGSSAATSGSASGNVNVNGTTFRLTSWKGVETPRGQNYLLTLSDTTLTAKFCNSMSGSYTLANGKISAPKLMSTLMYCQEPVGVMDAENAFGKVMAEGATFSVSGSTATITAKNGDKMVFDVFMD